MPSVTSSGLGSGIDIKGIVEQLVAAERAPRESALNREITSHQAQLSAFGSLRASLEEFDTSLAALQDIATFQQRSANNNDSDFFTAEADNTAASGKYDVEVQSLAQHHKIASTAYTDNSTAIGTGTLDITVDGNTFSLVITDIGGSDSVESIRNAINNASDNVGVTATIVEDDDGSHLVLSSTETGKANEITVVVTTDGGDTGTLSDLAFDPTLIPITDNPMAEKGQALDSVVVVDGFTKSSSSLTVEGIIQGVTLTLKEADIGNKHELSISLDKTSTKGLIDKFVTSYNALIGNINALTSYDADTGTAGLLQGDATVNLISLRLRQGINSVISSAANTDLDTLAELGITTDFSTGTLSSDAEKLNDFLDSDFDAIGTLFAGDTGLAARIEDILEPYLKLDGILDVRDDGFNSGIERVNDQFIALDKRMESVEARYSAQFLAMDLLVAELTNTGNFLTTQLEGIGNIINFRRR